jgi:hypothetical protein
MKTNVEKARAALAAGQADEAFLYAWNALGDLAPDDKDAAELVRIARTLDDPRLLREIERRGFRIPPERAEKPAGSRVENWARRLARAWPVLAFVIVVATIAHFTNKPDDRYPTTKDVTAGNGPPRPLRTESSGVWLVPLGDVASVDVARLAQELALRYHLLVRTRPSLALPRWTLDEEERSLVAEQLIRLLRQGYLAQRSGVVVGITDFAMYVRSEDLPHTFSWRAPPHYGVVSTSGLGSEAVPGGSRHVRTRKLVARNIGFLYLRRPEVDDRHSLLRPSMNGIDDIDELDERL